MDKQPGLKPTIGEIQAAAAAEDKQPAAGAGTAPSYAAHSPHAVLEATLSNIKSTLTAVQDSARSLKVEENPGHRQCALSLQRTISVLDQERERLAKLVENA